jgi:hypothetical protein
VDDVTLDLAALLGGERAAQDLQRGDLVLAEERPLGAVDIEIGQRRDLRQTLEAALVQHRRLVALQDELDVAVEVADAPRGVAIDLGELLGHLLA